MKRTMIILMLSISLIGGMNSGYAATWHLVAAFEPGSTGSNENWLVDKDAINRVRPDYVEAWIKSEYNPAVRLGEDEKFTQLSISYIGFSKDRQFCVVRATQYFSDRTLQSDSAECQFQPVHANSPADYIWKYLFDAN